MSVALTKPWSIEQFLSWAVGQEGRFEFDGFQPVAMTGGSFRHSRITLNIHAALRSRLRGTPCSYFGPDAGVRTVGNAVRYPDALVTCTTFDETERLAPDPLIVFEVLSPDSGRRDRIEKAIEYASVPSIRTYIIVESSGVGLTVMHRPAAGDTWAASIMTAGDVVRLAGLGIEIPVAEFYENVVFPEGPASPE